MGKKITLSELETPQNVIDATNKIHIAISKNVGKSISVNQDIINKNLSVTLLVPSNTNKTRGWR